MPKGMYKAVKRKFVKAKKSPTYSAAKPATSNTSSVKSKVSKIKKAARLKVKVNTMKVRATGTAYESRSRARKAIRDWSSQYKKRR